MKKTNMICIVCPIGCELSVERTAEGVKVEGNKCSRGIPYAEQELIHPMRTITSTVRIDGWIYSVIPVKTSKPIPKDKIVEVMNLLSDVALKAPVKVGDVVIKNVLGLGIDIVATSQASIKSL